MRKADVEYHQGRARAERELAMEGHPDARAIHLELARLHESAACAETQEAVEPVKCELHDGRSEEDNRQYQANAD